MYEERIRFTLPSLQITPLGYHACKLLDMSQAADVNIYFICLFKILGIKDLIPHNSSGRQVQKGERGGCDR